MKMNTLRNTICSLLLAGASASLHAAAADDAGRSAAILDTYCQDCHNSVDWAGSLALDTLDITQIPADAQTWETVVRKLRGRLMPPPTEQQPTQASIDAVVTFLEGRLDEHAARHPAPGFISLHRLNRTEYERAVSDILGVNFDASALLPREVRNEGFDNVANVLKVSPSFLDQYLWAAREVSLQAVGDAKSARASAIYRPGPEDARLHVPGMPLGTRGGLQANHFFPVDGEYTFNIGGGGGRGGPAGGYGVFGDERASPTVLLVDGVPVWDSAAAPAESRSGRGIKVQVKAGMHKIALATAAGALTESDDLLRPLNPSGGGIRPAATTLEIVAPATASANGLPDTPSRLRIFLCRPASEAEETPCAQRILERIAREAFRRPVSAEDMDAPLRFYEAGRRAGDFDAGIQQGIMAILASPKFLYRAEAMPEGLAPGDTYRISDLDLASRLSFFLWSRGPDEELLQLGISGRLHDPVVLEAQVKRMLADERSRSLVTNFAFQWLVVDRADEIIPDQSAFPEFDANLRAGMRRELELFVDSILRGNHSVMDLLTADHTFVNERVALHYGLTGVRGNEFRRITWQDPNRFGLLGKGHLLLATSYGDRTSPVLRGSWILDNLIGTPPTPPPPGVEALTEGNNARGRPLTIRARLEVHREQKSCNSCHGVIDPLGFALENFDAVGKWRTVDRASLDPIEAGDRMVSGEQLEGPADLHTALAARPAQFAQTLTEKLMVFALGRTVEYHDMPMVRAIVRDAAQDDYRFASIVLGIVNSDAFRMRQVPEPATTAEVSSTAQVARHASNPVSPSP